MSLRQLCLRNGGNLGKNGWAAALCLHRAHRVQAAADVMEQLGV